MGQQQLLLVLGAVIVGLASVGVLEAFEDGQRRSAIDHMTKKAVDIATDVQVYAQQPRMLRPKNTTATSGDDEDLVVGFSELQHYDAVSDGAGGDDYEDEVATYSLNGHNSLPDDYNPDACPGDPINTVNAYSETHDVSVCVSITGTSADDLEVGVAE